MPDNSHNTVFADEQAASLAVLIETAELLNGKCIDYAIIGGWIPYLFHRSPLGHPGTFDVDVLLNDKMKIAEVEAALDAFLAVGYVRAAKNSFQLYRILKVNGESMAFHVDFIHRNYADGANDLIIHWGPYQSIAAPGTDLIFIENEKEQHDVSGVFPDGTSKSVRVTFATELGFLSTKGRSVDVGKRTRDAYDVFLVVRQSQDRERLASRGRELMNKSGVFKSSMYRLRWVFATGHALDQAVHHLVKSGGIAPEEARELVMRETGGFFREIGMDERAPAECTSESASDHAKGIVDTPADARDGADAADRLIRPKETTRWRISWAGGAVRAGVDWCAALGRKGRTLVSRASGGGE